MTTKDIDPELRRRLEEDPDPEMKAFRTFQTQTDRKKIVRIPKVKMPVEGDLDDPDGDDDDDDGKGVEEDEEGDDGDDDDPMKDEDGGDGSKAGGE